MKKETVPYENATSGAAARDEVGRLLRKFGCESVGFMDDFENNALILAFKHRGRPVQLKATATGWAAMYMRVHPYRSAYARKTRQQYEAAALAQGVIAVNSILRDWVKGQVTAVECGILSFTDVFMPYMLLPSGERLVDYVMSKNLLPAPEAS